MSQPIWQYHACTLDWILLFKVWMGQSTIGIINFRRKIEEKKIRGKKLKSKAYNMELASFASCFGDLGGEGTGPKGSCNGVIIITTQIIKTRWNSFLLIFWFRTIVYHAFLLLKLIMKKHHNWTATSIVKTFQMQYIYIYICCHISRDTDRHDPQRKLIKLISKISVSKLLETQ